MDREFITALRVVGDQGGNRVELEAGTFEGQNTVRGLHQIVFDVRPSVDGEAHRNRHGVALTRTTDDEVLERGRAEGGN